MKINFLNNLNKGSDCGLGNKYIETLSGVELDNINKTGFYAVDKTCTMGGNPIYDENNKENSIFPAKERWSPHYLLHLEAEDLSGVSDSSFIASFYSYKTQLIIYADFNKIYYRDFPKGDEKWTNLRKFNLDFFEKLYNIYINRNAIDKKIAMTIDNDLPMEYMENKTFHIGYDLSYQYEIPSYNNISIDFGKSYFTHSNGKFKLPICQYHSQEDFNRVYLLTKNDFGKFNQIMFEFGDVYKNFDKSVVLNYSMKGFHTYVNVSKLEVTVNEPIDNKLSGKIIAKCSISTNLMVGRDQRINILIREKTSKKIVMTLTGAVLDFVSQCTLTFNDLPVIEDGYEFRVGIENNGNEYYDTAIRKLETTT